MILIIKHVLIEGPGIISGFLERKGYRLCIVELDRGGPLPGNFENIEAVIALGGPMNVYEEGKYPFLKDEDVFIREAVTGGVPFLGICLGAQLLAKSAGSSVTKASQEEIGFYRVRLTDKGASDIIFDGLDGEIDVFQWHEDTFDVPEGGVLLATAGTCKNQAFRIGENAYGFQFHIEINGRMLEEWIDKYIGDSDTSLRQKGKQMLARYAEVRDRLTLNAEKILVNFEKVIKSRKSR